MQCFYFFVALQSTYRNQEVQREEFLRQLGVERSQSAAWNHVTLLDLTILVSNALGLSYVLTTDVLGVCLTFVPNLGRPLIG